jgi:hypothetical protein
MDRSEMIFSRHFPISPNTTCGDLYERNFYLDIDGEIERKRLLGRPKIRWDNIIKVDLEGICFGGVRNLTQNRDKLAGVCEKDNEVPSLLVMRGVPE